MRLGILGGSFDPIHVGHLIAAESVREAFQLDQIVFVPANQPPHKSPAVAPPHLRLRMTELAVRSHLGFRVSDLEIRRGGVSYTVDTLTDLSRAEPASKLYFILGADLVPGLSSWKSWDQASTLATFVAVHRPISGPPPAADPLAAVKYLEIPAVDISSSAIRSRVAAGKSVRFLVPAPVQDLIEEEGLYRDAGA